MKAEVEKMDAARKGWFGGFDHPEFEVTVQPQHSLIYKIKLFGPIEDSNQFNSAIEAFERAGEEDKVLIHLSTPGGNLDATDTFIHAMRNCAAPIHVVASGGVHSAGTIILLEAPSFSLSENFNSLIHNGSTGSYGKMSDYRAETKFTSFYMESVMRRTYAGFLTDAEIEQLIEGKDFWMGPKEFCERADRRSELQAEQRRQQALEQLEGVQEELEQFMQQHAQQQAKPAAKKPRKKPATV